MPTQAHRHSNNIRPPALLLAATLTLLAGVVHAASGHNHGTAASPCADREAPASLRCALAPTGAFDAKGRLWLAWAFGGHVYLSRSDDRGASFSDPVPVNRIPERVAADGENRPKVVPGRDGQLYVAWTQRLDRPYTGHIRFARSDDGGASFSAPVTVNDHRGVTSHRFESLAVNARGDLYIAWLDKRDRVAAEQAGGAYTGAGLYYAVSRDGGRSFQTNRKIADHTCECCRTAMALDGDLPVIAWRHVYPGNIRDHALVRFLDADTPGEPQRLSHDQWQIDACPHHGPALAVTDGTYHAVWFNNAPERHGLFYARAPDPEQGFSEPLPVGDYQRAAAHPALSAHGEKVWLAWKEFDGERTRLLAMRSADGGRTWAPADAVATTAGESDHPQLLRDGKAFFASWQTADEGFHLFPLGDTP